MASQALKAINEHHPRLREIGLKMVEDKGEAEKWIPAKMPSLAVFRLIMEQHVLKHRTEILEEGKVSENVLLGLRIDPGRVPKEEYDEAIRILQFYLSVYFILTASR